MRVSSWSIHDFPDEEGESPAPKWEPDYRIKRTTEERHLIALQRTRLVTKAGRRVKKIYRPMTWGPLV